jgi:hypothetical protein
MSVAVHLFHLSGQHLPLEHGHPGVAQGGRLGLNLGRAGSGR